MKKYDNYKDSGIEWIGEIPTHWEINRLKFIGDAIGGLTYSPDDIVENESEGKLVLRSSNIQNGKLSLDDNVYVNKQIPEKLKVRKGDILICSRNGSQHLIGKNICIDERTEGNTFGAFMMIFRSNNFRFLNHFFNSPIFTSQSGLFLTSTINQLTSTTLNNFYLAIPNSIEEQTTISNYLDQKTSEIDALVSKKERLIELLEEERTAIINHAVTKGLDPTVKMKDSGIEWLGEIPEHWEVPKIWHLVMMQKLEIQDGNHGSQYPKQEDFKKEGIFFIKPRDIRNGGVNFDTCDCLTVEHAESLRIGFSKPKDILLVNRGGTIGRMARMQQIPNNLDYVIINPQMTYIRCNDAVDSDFTYYQCLSDVFQQSLEQVKAYGSTFSFLGLSNMGDFPFILPPISEQKNISNYINMKLTELDSIILKIKNEIDLIKEYKTALISEVVTGKIDVRNEVLN